MSEAPRVVLVACSDDWLLERQTTAAANQVAAGLGDAPVVELGSDVSPARVADELVTPSLFEPVRVLLVRDVLPWLTAAPGSPDMPAPKAVDPAPLAAALAGGPPAGVGLVMAAWCRAQPKGPLVKAVKAAGEVRWIKLPAPPKPWEEVSVSRDQRELLLRILAEELPDLELTPAAQSLILDRLGFAPRLLLVEAAKLAAASAGRPVGEELVRRLVIPRERSLEVVRDAVLTRRPGPILDLLQAGSAGVPVRDFRGKQLDVKGVMFIVFNQVTRLLLDLLVIRRVLDREGLAAEMAPSRVGRRDWYPRHFKNGLGPRLQELLAGAPAVQVGGGGRSPSVWALGDLVRGASRFSDLELTTALAAAGDTERGLRTDGAAEGLTSWLVETLRA